MMDIQAALGLHQLARIENYLERREALWDRYDQSSAGYPVHRPAKPSGDIRHARHLYTLLVDERTSGLSRDDFQKELHKEGIGTGVHFVALHLHPYYAATFGWRQDQFPQAKYLSDRTVSLPLSAKLTDDDSERVTSAVQKTIESAVSRRQTNFAFGGF